MHVQPYGAPNFVPSTPTAPQATPQFANAPYYHPQPFFGFAYNEHIAASPHGSIQMPPTPRHQFHTYVPAYLPSNGAPVFVPSTQPQAIPFIPTPPKPVREKLQFVKPDTNEVVKGKIEKETPPTPPASANPVINAAPTHTPPPGFQGPKTETNSEVESNVPEVSNEEEDEPKPTEQEVEIDPEDLYPAEYIKSQWSPFNQVSLHTSMAELLLIICF